MLSFSAITDCKNLNGYVLIDSENMETWEKVFCIAFQDVCAASLFGFLCSQPWIQVFVLYFVLFGIFCICIAFEDPSVLSLFGFLCSQPWIIIFFLFYFAFFIFCFAFWDVCFVVVLLTAVDQILDIFASMHDFNHPP